MRVVDWLVAVVFAVMVVADVGFGTGAAADTHTALAPTGNLRVAFLSTAPQYAKKDAATGELKGVAPDLGQELARRLGVPYVPVGYSNVPAIISGAKSGELDVALMGITAERATAMDFSAPFMEVELGFLVRAGAPISGAGDVDKAGVRIGVLEKGGADVHLSSTLKQAELVRGKDLAELYAMMGAGKADVLAGTKMGLFAEAEKQPGSRVLEGRILAEPIGVGVPKGRDPSAAAFVGKVVEEAKANGLVKSAIERAGLRGVVVAP